MDVTIQILDAQAYEALSARAVLKWRTVGELVNDAIRGYLGRPIPGTGSLRALTPNSFLPATIKLSSEIDDVVYGGDR